jgi:hypothetical protein
VANRTSTEVSIPKRWVIRLLSKCFDIKGLDIRLHLAAQQGEPSHINALRTKHEAIAPAHNLQPITRRNSQLGKHCCGESYLSFGG